MTWLLAALAYIVPTFPLGYIWHLTVFKERYRQLEVYRDSVMPPLGLASMIIQGVAFGWIYASTIVPATADGLQRAGLYALLGGLLSWSFTTLAAATKNRMTSVRGFFGIETLFTAVQWVVVAILTVLIAG